MRDNRINEETDTNCQEQNSAANQWLNKVPCWHQSWSLQVGFYTKVIGEHFVWENDGEAQKLTNMSPRRLGFNKVCKKNDLRRVFNKFVHENTGSSDISVNVSAGSFASVLQLPFITILPRIQEIIAFLTKAHHAAKYKCLQEGLERQMLLHDLNRSL